MNEEKRQHNSQVNEKISDAEEAMTQLQGSVETICEALSPVQIDAVPQGGDDTKAMLDEELCPLAARISTLVSRIRSARAKIESEHERVRL
jgi:seryl-tRNA synthetase